MGSLDMLTDAHVSYVIHEYDMIPYHERLLQAGQWVLIVNKNKWQPFTLKGKIDLAMDQVAEYPGYLDMWAGKYRGIASSGSFNDKGYWKFHE